MKLSTLNLGTLSYWVDFELALLALEKENTPQEVI